MPSKQHQLAGAKGGRAKVPKGFAMMDKELHRQLARKGGKVGGRVKRPRKSVV